MAKETMAEKAKKQKASKVSGLYEGVGKFKGKKSLNLRDKQLGKKGRAAAAKRTVSISKTEHMKEGPNKGKVVGPKGNPLTGKVDMGGGNMAVYRNGKRVTAKSSKGVKPKVTSPKAKTTTLTAAQKAAKAKTTTTPAQKGSGSNAGASAGARKVSDNSSGQSRVAAGRIDGVKVSKKSRSGLDASNWGKGGSTSLSLPSFLKPGKNAPKMPKYTSSSTYKWKG